MQIIESQVRRFHRTPTTIKLTESTIKANCLRKLIYVRSSFATNPLAVKSMTLYPLE